MRDESPAKPRERKGKTKQRLTLHPLSLEDALKAVFQTGPLSEERKRGKKAAPKGGKKGRR